MSVATVLRLLPESTAAHLGRGSDAAGATSSSGELWRFETVQGRLVELSAQGASAVLTTALWMVIDAQRRGEHVAWIVATPDGSAFYPPDAARAGVDLDALAVIHTPDGAHQARLAGRAATHLLRSGSFGLVVLDMGRDPAGKAALSLPLQSRLVGLAQHHGAGLLCLTEKPDDAPSLGSLVSLRVAANRVGRAGAPGDGRYLVTLAALKDKRRGPGQTLREVCDGPPGLR